VHKTQVFQAEKIQLCYQPLPDSASVRGCGWQISTQLATASLPSGWYIVEVAQGARSWRQSVFIAPQRVQKRVAMLLCTHTWNAYNAWGGQSLYTKNYAHTVSFLRPQPLSDPFLPDNFTNQQYRYQSARQDRHLAALFAQQQIEYDAYDIGALENNIEQLKKYDIITISTHSEYWTKNMLRHLNEYLAQGGSLISLSGNTAAYISYLDTQNHTLSVYKSEANLWRTSDSLRMRTGQLPLKPFGTETAFEAFHTYAPYRVAADTSWVLANTGLKRGDTFGERSDCYDYTYANGATWAQLWRGLMRKNGFFGAASGMEVDKCYAGTPPNFVLLATGCNPAAQGHGEVFPEKSPFAWDEKGGADMGYYPHSGGGIVFTAGSIAASGAIPYSKSLQMIVINVVHRALR
jgi:hypothetical protein